MDGECTEKKGIRNFNMNTCIEDRLEGRWKD
jgi:hypothetical protein